MVRISQRTVIRDKNKRKRPVRDREEHSRFPWSFKQNKQMIAEVDIEPTGHFGMPRSSSALKGVVYGVYCLHPGPPLRWRRSIRKFPLHRSVSKVYVDEWFWLIERGHLTRLPGRLLRIVHFRPIAAGPPLHQATTPRLIHPIPPLLHGLPDSHPIVRMSPPGRNHQLSLAADQLSASRSC